MTNATDRPNILFLMSDEHRPDVTGYEGNRVVRTPTLDWLAETGTVFRNAYCPSPICVPCRQSLATGQLPKTCGVERHGQDLPPFSMTFAKRLSQFGYDSCCCGKLHHMGVDQMQGWTRRIAGDTGLKHYFIEGRDQASWNALAGREPGTGKWSDAKECQRAGFMPERGEKDKTQAALSAIDKKYIDSRYDRPNPAQPWLFKVSYIRPHYPYFTTRQKFEYYLNRVPIHLESEAFDHPFLRRRQVRPGVDASERDIRRATAAYYGMVEEIDEDYRTIIDRLRDVGQDLDDWIIIYCSDHGEMLGQHGIWEKQKFFEASARVPLIIRWPNRFRPRVVHENVNLCDIFATLCDLCAVPLPPTERTVNGAGLDSRSLVPLMEGNATDWDNETISQFGGTNLMIKRDALKYHRYDGDDCVSQPEVLFDLETDPHETRNLVGEPQYNQTVAQFRTRCAKLGFGEDADTQYVNAGY